MSGVGVGVVGVGVEVGAGVVGVGVVGVGVVGVGVGGGVGLDDCARSRRLYGGSVTMAANCKLQTGQRMRRG
jgi:hypothetical protein